MMKIIKNKKIIPIFVESHRDPILGQVLLALAPTLKQFTYYDEHPIDTSLDEALDECVNTEILYL